MSSMPLKREFAERACSAKPIELYLFIDPVCPDCWKLQETFRKLQIYYEHYFTYRIVLSTSLAALNAPTAPPEGAAVASDGRPNFSHPVLPSLAVKAAEFQGKRAGSHYLNRLQEKLFLESVPVTSYDTLLAIAEEVHLDAREFESDFRSDEVFRLFQSDMKITHEMEVEEFPSLVFFNGCIEDEGIKVPGRYPFDVYVEILSEMLGCLPDEKETPAIDALFRRFQTLSTREVASIYDISEAAALRELKKRMLLQQIERIPSADNCLWRAKQNALS